MKRFLKNYRLPENIEALFMLMIGIVLQMTDGSPFSLEERWLLVWETDLPSQYFSQFVQKFIKTVLSIIVVVRCLTTYAYVVSAMLVICCIVKDTSPKLMLLWLLISAIKSVFMTFLEALTGVYVCSAFGKIRKACIEFFISKALEIIFAAYLWASVLNIYREMERKAEQSTNSENWEQLFMQKMTNRRQRTRSLLDESTLYKTACLNHFEFRDVPQIILQMLRREEEMSEDSLLGPGMMLASVSNLGSFDNLKTSQSLGELGLVDLKSTQVMGLEDDEMLSPPEKALKFLKLTWSDVRNTQRNKKTVENEVYVVDDDTWNKITAKGANVNKPKRPRAEIILKEIPHFGKESEEGIRNTHRTKSLELKFGWSLINFFQEQNAQLIKALEEQDEELLSIAYNQEEDDITDSPLMSNIRDEILVNRIRLDFVSKTFKANAYANLYKQEYMSVIGPEVFERASKLPKVTSFTKYHDREGMRRSSSLPALSDASGRSRRKINFDDDVTDKEDMVTSKSDLFVNNFEQTKDRENSKERLSIATRQYESDQQTSNSTESDYISFEESLQKLLCQEIQDDTKSKFNGEVSGRKNQNTNSNCSPKTTTDKEDSKQVNDSRECCQEKMQWFRKRKINIRRIGRRINVQISSEIPSSDDKNSPNDSENDSDNSSPSKTSSECFSKDSSPDAKSHSKTSGSENSFRGECSGDKKEISKTGSNQFFFFAELMQQPLIDVLIAYKDLKNKLNPHRNIDDLLYMPNMGLEKNLFRAYQTFKGYEKLVHFLPFEDNKNAKVWKSKVLKTVTENNESNHRKSFQNEFIFNFFKMKLANENILGNNGCGLLAKNPYGNWSNYNILKSEENHCKTQSLKSEKCRKDDLIVKSFVFLDSSDSEESVYSLENRRSLKTKNKMEDNFLFKTSSISMLSDASDKRLSSSSLQNVVPRKSLSTLVSGSNGDRNSSEINPNRLLLIRKWLNSSYADDVPDSNNVSVKISETETYQEHGTSLDIDKLVNRTNVEELTRSVKLNKKKVLPTPSDTVNNFPDQDSLCSQDSDEPFSLYYSKAADLASPLLDMRRFIYPDHIHYSYKHVKKKGFDVDISGGLPLIVRESLTMNTPVSMKHVSAPSNPELGITRKPMDLSFATTNAFTEWQNSDKSTVASESNSLTKNSSQIIQNPRMVKNEKKFNYDLSKSKKMKKAKRSKKSKDTDQSYRYPKSEEVKNCKSKSQFRNTLHSKHFYSIKDYLLLQKLLKMYRRKINTEFKKSDNFEKERSPIQISSTQLHSNKGRINSTYNPAISLHENKTRTEKKKMETQEERTKVMFARLERELLLQYKNVNKTFGPLRHI